MILVTGGTGFLGAHLLYKLCQKHDEIIALRRSKASLDKARHLFSSNENGDRLFNKIRWIEGDLLDILSLTDAVKGIDSIYHCAAVVSFDKGRRHELLQTNIKGTANLMNVALQNGIKKLVHVSTVATLNRSETDEIIDESCFWKPSPKHSGYSTSKYEAEKEVWRAIEEGLDAVILNPSIILGAWDWKSGTSGMFTEINNGLMFYPSGSNGFIDVEDVANAMIMAMESDVKNERFILNSENLKFKQLLDFIAHSIGKKAPSVRLRKSGLEIAWRTDVIRSIITGTGPVLTREMAIASYNDVKYSSDKFKSRFRYDFKPVKESIEQTAIKFLKDRNNNK